MADKYFSDEILVQHNFGSKMEIRAEFAKQLLDRFGIIAGTKGAEDSAGRATFVHEDPKQLVERAFAISDAFFDMAESRGDVQALTLSQEDRARAVGKLERLRSRAAWERDEEPQGVR